jgi:hypothetical protein
MRIYDNDLEGKKFNMLTVIKKVGKDKRKNILWLCKCDCGNDKTAITTNIKNGNILSCGCIKKHNNKTHGKTETKLFKVFQNIKQRCYNQNNKKYKNYGERGIVICDDWLNDFTNFYNWAMDNGYQEDSGLTLDRIDVNGNYEPGNCRWADMKTQQNNKTINLNVTINGKTQTAKQWEEEYNLTQGTVARRLRLGWEEDKLLIPPKKAKKTSGVRGVSWFEPNQLWNVRVSIDGVIRKIGSSKSLEKAIKIKQDYINKLNTNNGEYNACSSTK